MSAPELLLPRLYQALADIVAAADAVVDGPINDEGESVEEVFRPIMRRLLLCQTLGQFSLLAIAGTQGAGKPCAPCTRRSKKRRRLQLPKDAF